MSKMFPNIDAERVRSKWSQQHMIELMDVSLRTWRNWMAGKSEIPSSKLLKMAELWGVSTDYLLGLTDVRGGKSA